MPEIYQWLGDALIQRSTVTKDLEWQVPQTADTVNPLSEWAQANPEKAAKSRYAKTLRRDGATWGDVVPKDREVLDLAHPDDRMTCQSCHMPYVTKNAASAGAAVVGQTGRMADVKTHIFRIDTRPVSYTSMFSADGKEVVRDDQGRAAVTLDFVCLRCHNGVAAFAMNVDFASGVAERMHAKFE